MPKSASAAQKRDWKACRSLGTVSAAVLAAVTLSTTALQDVIANGDTRTLSFLHMHTKETLTVTFKKNGRYDDGALKQINHLLRDWRNDRETKMDPHLFDLLWEVSRETGAKAPVNIVSAYRSPQTNSMLRSRGRGVAKHSQHMVGKAIDFFIPDVALSDLRAIGLRLQRGGVGFYPTSGSPFVHMDTGTIRHWPRMTRDQLVKVFPDGKTVHVPTDGRPLKNFELAATELQRRGQFGERTLVANAIASPDGNQLRRFISSIFGANTQTANNNEAESDEENAAPRTPLRTQVASADPNAVPPMRWNEGPASATEPPMPRARPDDAPNEFTASTGGTRPLAYASADPNEFPPIEAIMREQRPQLAAAAFAPGAERATSYLIKPAKVERSPEFSHPTLGAQRGFATPANAALDNRFERERPEQLVTARFGKERPVLNVIGFDAPVSRTAAAR